MKRDLDLARRILIKIEAELPPMQVGTFTPSAFSVENKEEWDWILEHFRLLADAGFIEKGSLSSGGYTLRGITWAGHEFLDSIRDEEVWRRTKEGANKVGSWSLETLSEIARAIAKKKLRDLTDMQF